MLKFKVELEYSELVYVRLDMLEKIKKNIWKAPDTGNQRVRQNYVVIT